MPLKILIALAVFLGVPGPAGNGISEVLQRLKEEKDIPPPSSLCTHNVPYTHPGRMTASCPSHGHEKEKGIITDTGC